MMSTPDVGLIECQTGRPLCYDADLDLLNRTLTIRGRNGRVFSLFQTFSFVDFSFLEFFWTAILGRTVRTRSFMKNVSDVPRSFSWALEQFFSEKNLQKLIHFTEQ